MKIEIIEYVDNLGEVLQNNLGVFVFETIPKIGELIELCGNDKAYQIAQIKHVLCVPNYDIVIYVE